MGQKIPEIDFFSSSRSKLSIPAFDPPLSSSTPTSVFPGSAEVALIAAAGVDVVADLMATHGRELWAVAAAAGGACGGWGRSLAR